MNETTLICLLDKPYPPDHSFVTGMLAQALPRDGAVRVQLLVMAPAGGAVPPTRYHEAACLPLVPDFTRGGRSRLRAMLAAHRLTRALIDKAQRRGERVVLFVRNHPALMLVAASLRHRADSFVFQSSYPLEMQDNRFGRLAHRTLLRVGGRRVDGVLAVSPLGLQRARALCSAKASGLVVPLLSDLPKASASEAGIWGSDTGSVRFIYTGTHAARRRLDIVLEGAVAALDAGVDAAFVFVGGKPKEVAGLRESARVRRWEGAGRIRFIEAVPRPKLPSLLLGADVGVSLIPALPQYREASPTKLAEYMGTGLAVLASRGVELQESFVSESSAGVVVPFEASSIAGAIHRMVSDPVFLATCKENAERFAKERLQYSYYVARLKAVINGEVTEDIGEGAFTTGGHVGY